MRNGNFVTYCKTESIQINTFPQKMRYPIGSYINQEGMEVIAIGQNGQNNIIENYECSNVQENGSVIITYNEAGNCYEVSFQVEIISVEEDLIDFEWYENDDGTYTLTEWKGTYNGEPSTKLIVPDNDLYYIGMEG